MRLHSWQQGLASPFFPNPLFSTDLCPYYSSFLRKCPPVQHSLNSPEVHSGPCALCGLHAVVQGLWRRFLCNKTKPGEWKVVLIHGAGALSLTVRHPLHPQGRLPQGGMDCYRVRLPSALRRKRGTLALRSKNRSTMNTRRPKRAWRVAAGSRGRRASDVAAAAVCAGGGVPAVSAAALSTQPHSTLKQLRRHPRFPRITSRHLTTARPCSG